MVRIDQSNLSTIVLLIAVAGMTSCGKINIIGGGSSQGFSGGSSASYSLSYTVQRVTYVNNSAITNNVPSTNAPVVSYSVSPALPTGLSFDTSTGIVSGTPTSTIALADYTVTLNTGSGTVQSTLSVAVAEGWVVDSTADASDFSTADGFCDTDDSVGDGPCTLRAAVEQANVTGGTRVISVPTGTITMNTGGLGSMTLGSGALTSLDISGQGSSGTVVDGATTAPRLFSTSNATNVSFLEMTIQNSRDTTEGAFLRHVGSGTVTVENCTISGNEATAGPVGALAGDTGSGTITIRGSTFNNNQATSAGGAVGAYETLVVENTTFLKNTCTVASCSGGAIWSDGPLTISGTTFDQNSADNGGALRHGSVAVATITDTTFVANRADVTGAGSGGAVRGDAGSDLDFTDVTFDSNVATGSGGAIRYVGGGAPVSDFLRVTLHSNTADQGGAIHISDVPTVNMTNVTMSQNSTTRDGGALSVVGGGGLTTLTLNQSTIANNRCDSDSSGVGDGGAIQLTNGNTINLVQTAFANNLDDATPSNCLNLASTINAGQFNLVDTIASDCNMNTGAANPDIVSTSHGIATAVVDNGGSIPSLAITSSTSSIVDYIPSGSCFSALDARSSSRPNDGNGDSTAACDIGAFEL